MTININNFQLAIGIPNSHDILYSDFFDSFICMEKPPFIYIRERGTVNQIDEMRNNIVMRAKNTGATHLLMMDCDQTYPTNLISKLLRDIKDKMVVGALVHRRYPPFDPLIIKGKPNHYQTIIDWPEGEIIPVDATGTGCLMFDMRVFDIIKKPWFKLKKRKTGMLGEDFYFCDKAKKSGVQVYVDTSLQCGHLALMEVGVATWELYKHVKIEQIQRREIKGQEV